MGVSSLVMNRFDFNCVLFGVCGRAREYVVRNGHADFPSSGGEKVKPGDGVGTKAGLLKSRLFSISMTGEQRSEREI
jgi:hypothetical protein